MESRLKSDDLIGNVVVATHSERNFIRPRPVNFGWQRGIKIGKEFTIFVYYESVYLSRMLTILIYEMLILE